MLPFQVSLKGEKDVKKLDILNTVSGNSSSSETSRNTEEMKEDDTEAE